MMTTRRKKDESVGVANKKVKVETSVTLNEQQINCIDAVKNGKNVFITGPGGVGKSLVLQTIIEYFETKFKVKEGKAQNPNGNGTSRESFAVVTPTGISATALPHGQTIHAFSGVGAPERKEDFKKAWNNTFGKRDCWRKLRVLIIDEISMLPAEFLDYLSDEICEIRNTHLTIPFGGIQLIFCGDFLQLPPIPRPIQVIRELVDMGIDQSILYNARGFAFQSNVWKNANLTYVELKHNYRQADAALLNANAKIRRGIVDEETRQVIMSCDRKLPNKQGIQATELYATNKDVDHVNMERLNKLSGKKIVYSSHDYVVVDLDDNAKITKVQAEDFLRKLSFFDDCIASRSLTLKPSAQVMRIKNEGGGGQVNGSRGVVLGFANITAKKKPYEELEDGDYEILTENYSHRNLPVVRYLNGEEKVVPYEVFSQRIEGIGSCTRSQIPLKLAWAITVHKSQGMSIDYLKVDLSKVFADGQTYVALSRARSKEGLEVRGFSDEKVNADERALEFYKDPNADFPHWTRAWSTADEALTETDSGAVMQVPTVKKGALQDLNIVVTGDPLGISRPKLEKLIKDCGGNLMKNVSGKTNYLVIGTEQFGDGRSLVTGTKYKRAKQIIGGPNRSDLQIINQAQLYELIGSHTKKDGDYESNDKVSSDAKKDGDYESNVEVVNSDTKKDGDYEFNDDVYNDPKFLAEMDRIEKYSHHRRG